MAEKPDPGAVARPADQLGATKVTVGAPEIPPAMAQARRMTVDELVSEMNRTPLFMTTLDETDGEAGENMDLEALKALAYDGTRAEIAQNFREQGNDLAKVKRWSDAKEFYDKALAALKAPRKEQELEEIADEDAELEKERVIAEACYVNRALCNLEKQNYRSCNLDCALALRLNPRNVKAWYRSASACLAIDKLAEAADACSRGLEIEPENGALKALLEKIQKRKEHLAGVEKQRREREERQRAEEKTLALALRERKINLKTTGAKPDMEDAELKLENPLDMLSKLSIPVVLLYSIDMQSDFIKSFKEDETIAQHLEYILPLPWDGDGEYKLDSLDCYIETIAGGLIKAGKKLPLVKILASGKVQLVDGLLKIHVVPKSKAEGWIAEYKKRMKVP